MQIFVYGLSYKTRRENLAELFSQFGTVTSPRIIVDPETRRSRGYGFVEMEESEAMEAIKALDNTEYMGRIIHATVADDRQKIARTSAQDESLAD